MNRTFKQLTAEQRYQIATLLSKDLIKNKLQYLLAKVNYGYHIYILKDI